MAVTTMNAKTNYSTKRIKAFILVSESKFYKHPWVGSVFTYGKKKKDGSLPDFAGDSMNGAYRRAVEHRKKLGDWVKITIKKGFVTVKI